MRNKYSTIILLCHTLPVFPCRRQQENQTNNQTRQRKNRYRLLQPNLVSPLAYKADWLRYWLRFLKLFFCKTLFSGTTDAQKQHRWNVIILPVLLPFFYHYFVSYRFCSRFSSTTLFSLYRFCSRDTVHALNERVLYLFRDERLDESTMREI